MTNAGIQPSNILKACSHLSPIHGKAVHAWFIKQGLDSFTSIGNSIMDFYVKLWDLGTAFDVFGSMTRSRDSVSWNILIHGCLRHGAQAEGLRCFSSARVAGFEPNVSTLVLVIQACRRLRARFEGLQLHSFAIQSGFCAFSSVQNSLLSMHVDADIECASQLFVEMPGKDIISWSTLISGYVQNQEAQLGLQLFKEMISVPGIEPDGVVVVSVLKGCGTLLDLCMGRLVHSMVIHKGLDNDLFVQNSLIDVYSKCNDTSSAFKVFRVMPCRNNVSWNSMLSGFVHNEQYSEALLLVFSMRQTRVEADEVTLVNILQACKYLGHPFYCKSIHCRVVRRGWESNELVLTSLIDAYAKCNLVELAWEIFVRMRRRDAISWSTMIGGLACCGKLEEAIAVYQEMNETTERPNAVTLVNLIEACSVSAELRRSKWAHGVAIRKGFAGGVAVGTAIVDMYSKCGEVEASRKAFEEIPDKNIVSWSAMAAAFGVNGLGHEALALVTEMQRQGLKPNAVTTLSVLSACSHSGLVEEGMSFLKAMVEDEGVELGVEHYSCMVDMLGRAGRLEGAREVMKMMPQSVRDGARVWGALLSGCRNYGDSEVGEEAVIRVVELEPSNWAGYLMVSSMYAADGLWDEAARMRRLAKERGVRIVPGLSSVNILLPPNFINCRRYCSYAYRGGRMTHYLTPKNFVLFFRTYVKD